MRLLTGDLRWKIQPALRDVGLSQAEASATRHCREILRGPLHH